MYSIICFGERVSQKSAFDKVCVCMVGYTEDVAAVHIARSRSFRLYNRKLHNTV